MLKEEIKIVLQNLSNVKVTAVLRAVLALCILTAFGLFLSGCASIFGTEEKAVDANGLGAIADAKGMIGFIKGDYFSFPDTLNYFRYCRQETSGWFNSLSKDVRETVVVAWPATNAVMPNIVGTIDACRALVATNSIAR